jgi:hypothetical protein
MRDKRQWATPDGVVFTAYRNAAGSWIGSRQALGQPEEFLRAGKSPDFVESAYRRECPTQRQLGLGGLVERVNDVLHNDENSTDDELFDALTGMGCTPAEAERAIAQRQRCMLDMFYVAQV